MSTPADKVVITIDGSGYTVEVQATRAVIAEQTIEITDGGTCISKLGDDLFDVLPPDLAASLDAMDLMLMDCVIALMPDNA